MDDVASAVFAVGGQRCIPPRERLSAGQVQTATRRRQVTACHLLPAGRDPTCARQREAAASHDVTVCIDPRTERARRNDA